MKLSDLISRVRNIAGDVQVLQFTDQTVVDWVNDGIRECAVYNNLLQKTASTTQLAGTTQVTLPTDILKLHSVRVADDKLNILTQHEFDTYVGDTSSSAGSGYPQVGYVWAGQLNLWPKPANDFNLVINYIYTPTTLLVTDLANELPLPVAYHQRLVDYCLAQVAQQDDDNYRYQMKMQEFLTGVQQQSNNDRTEEDEYPTMSTSLRDAGFDSQWVEYYG